jgi:eukaryotic-like serine/threonine-protein kinase
MSTPSPKYFCPRCRAAFDVDSNYCGRCGADMHRASRLQRALQLDEDSSTRQKAIRDDVGSAKTPLDGSGPPIEIPPPEARRPRDRRGSMGPDPWLGRVVDNRYRVMDVLGRGGMGVVYKIEHQRMGKIAAMKVLHRDLAADREVIGRFRREAEAVSRLTHPNTVQVFDFGTAQGALYLVMEYVRGLDIGSLIDRDGAMSFQRAAPLFGQVCAALAEAHELGIVHRDLKPENILVTRTSSGHDYVKVLDFGLAKLAEREELSEVTGRGQIVGTPYYMSPEQIRGEEEVDGRSDIYSLGSLMYKVLTGEPAFTATSPVGVLTKHLTEAVTPPSRRATGRLPAGVDDIVLKAMQKRPADRYPSVGAMLEDIDAVYEEVHEHSSSGRRAVRQSQALREEPPDDGLESDRRLKRSDLDDYERSLRRRRWVWVAMFPILVAGGVAGGWYWLDWRARQPRTAEEEPNNSSDEATPIGSGVAVHGHLGRRISKTEPDRDHYRLLEVPAPSGGDQVTITVTALPNMDIALSLYDARDQLLAHRDDGGVGQPEHLRAHRVRSPVHVVVSESRPAASRALPTENVSDTYALTATLTRGQPEIESEPNDTAIDAAPLASPVAGWLDRRDDVDVYRFGGGAGRYHVAVTGADRVPVWVRRGGDQLGREARIQLAPGDIISVGRDDRTLPRDQELPGADQRYTLTVTPD